MKPRDLTDLLLLAAIWGGSFLFMRVAVPGFGPVALAFVRVAGAALLLLPLLLWRGEAGVLRQRWRPLLALGLFNSALPFLCFGYAVYTLPAALAAIFNAATPLFTALIAWAWLGEPLSRWRSLGALTWKPLANDRLKITPIVHTTRTNTPPGSGMVFSRTNSLLTRGRWCATSSVLLTGVRVHRSLPTVLVRLLVVRWGLILS